MSTLDLKALEKLDKADDQEKNHGGIGIACLHLIFS
ncbi:hypothetical protein DMNBHIDG_01594 [Candidatus Methanoperedenaceae archaeon GB37]|nr:hypothetical protein DMNBHIDG_01594 [Candidatus Methanoperedenaceae archaeon GB37]